jgi:acetate kinase
MGLTPSGGVIMGTRSGDLDPGVLMYLIRQQKLDLAALEELVDRRSGLLGISGLGSDMRSLHAAASSNGDARLAIQMFCYSVRKEIAAMIAALEGIEMIVFTGGIGENDARVRSMICMGLAYNGVILDEKRNEASEERVSAATSRCAVRILQSLEDEEIARHAFAVLAPGVAKPPADMRVV